MPGRPVPVSFVARFSVRWFCQRTPRRPSQGRGGERAALAVVPRLRPQTTARCPCPQRAPQWRGPEAAGQSSRLCVSHHGAKGETRWRGVAECGRWGRQVPPRQHASQHGVHTSAGRGGLRACSGAFHSPFSPPPSATCSPKAAVSPQSGRACRSVRAWGGERGGGAGRPRQQAPSVPSALALLQHGGHFPVPAGRADEPPGAGPGGRGGGHRGELWSELPCAVVLWPECSGQSVPRNDPGPTTGWQGSGCGKASAKAGAQKVTSGGPVVLMKGHWVVAAITMC